MLLNLSRPDYVGRQLKVKVSPIYWAVLEALQSRGGSIQRALWSSIYRNRLKIATKWPSRQCLCAAITDQVAQIEEKSCVASGSHGFWSIVSECREVSHPQPPVLINLVSIYEFSIYPLSSSLLHLLQNTISKMCRLALATLLSIYNWFLFINILARCPGMKFLRLFSHMICQYSAGIFIKRLASELSKLFSCRMLGEVMCHIIPTPSGHASYPFTPNKNVWVLCPKALFQSF